MGEKKNPGRFTIQLNLNDPQQQAVCELLEKQGRHKAQFITSAVLHYINCSETPEMASVPLADLDLIEKMVLEILDRHAVKNCQQPKTEMSHSIKPEPQFRPAPSDELQQFLGEEGISAIKNTLSAFQRT